VKTGLFAALLAQLRSGQSVFTSANAEGSAFGAAALVFDQLGSNPFVDETVRAAALGVFGLEAYRDAWRGMVEIDRHDEDGDGRKELLA
jgi:hypothetical protein